MVGEEMPCLHNTNTCNYIVRLYFNAHGIFAIILVTQIVIKTSHQCSYNIGLTSFPDMENI